MPYVIINPVNMTYDGGYFDKAHAEHMLQFCQTEYKQPATFMAFVDGVLLRHLSRIFGGWPTWRLSNQ
jgi:hypothetical protein